jgi:hypothetical protein
VDTTVQTNNSERLVHVTAGPVMLEGTLGIPEGARGIVLFAHGSGSSRFSPRNRAVAHALRAAKLATLPIDLLTPDEEAIDLRTRRLRFDITLLAERLVGATDWLTQPSYVPPADRLLRRQHWSRGRTGSRGRTSRRHRRGRLARWAARPRRRSLASRPCAHTADRRRE